VTFFSQGRGKDSSPALQGPVLSRPLTGLLLVLFLIAVVAAEQYAVFALRDGIARQGEELRRISLRLRTLKDERNTLDEELSLMKKRAGDKNNGTTPERNN
jgi:hypothetical protein